MRKTSSYCQLKMNGYHFNSVRNENPTISLWKSRMAEWFWVHPQFQQFHTLSVLKMFLVVRRLPRRIATMVQHCKRKWLKAWHGLCFIDFVWGLEQRKLNGIRPTFYQSNILLAFKLNGRSQPTEIVNGITFIRWEWLNFVEMNKIEITW